MTYFLVMGGLALSVCLTLGWALWRAGRWLFGRLAPRRASPSRAAAKPRRGAGAARRSAPSRAWRLTRTLAHLGGAWPLALLALLLYGGTRLAAHGMAARPHEAPDAFHRLVEALGWGTAGLAGLAGVGLSAAWRSRRA
ncbi:hypothetical protein [Halomonas beimenensis]|uniref:Uncharacterized protein n=1 Tax=Halomonas beimenensis TaxID=475662 RepID=A0A291P811_9GAMM|nr:hypothetical protein [Halomonas beimenensis]ATJ82992.1 hypothetical protein BEI_2005 [Halomonas beimenensis]